MNLLVINPNTSTYITDDLKVLIDQLDYPDADFSYYTSASGPSILASTADLHASTAHTLGPVLDIAAEYDGFLIACYADHPLTSLLQRHLAPKPVVGIFEASVIAAVGVLADAADPAIPATGGGGGGRFGIITTGQFYEAQLAHGVRRMLGGKGKHGRKAMMSSGPTADVFAGVASTGISPERLRTESPERIRRRIDTATKQLLLQGQDEGGGNGVEVICIGGVILAGMEDWVRSACVAVLGLDRGSRVVIVDQMAAGVDSLIGHVSGIRNVAVSIHSHLT